MKKLILVLFLLWPTSAFAACNGQFLAGYLCGNSTNALGEPQPTTGTSYFDQAFGNTQGTILNRGSSTWTNTATPTLGLNGTSGGSLILEGSTSGSATFAPQAVAGTTTLTLPTTTGTLADSANAPLVLSATTGVLTCPTCVTGTTGALTAGTTPTSGYSSGQILGSNGSVLSVYSVSGTGNVALTTSPTFTTPTISGLTVTGALTATGLVTNADLVNPSVTVNGTVCTLGSSCNPTAPAASITVGTTTVSGGPGILYNTSSGGTLTALVAVNSTVVSFNSSGVLQASATLPSNLSATNMTLTTPTLGVATGTSLALGGASIGSNAFAVTGSTLLNSALTYGGVTLSNSVTGTGSMVLSAAPTLTGHPTIEGVTSTGATGTGNLVFASSPTLTTPTVSGALSATSPPGTSAANHYSFIVAAGTLALGTTAISSGSCAAAVTATATGTATTDIIDIGFNSDPTGVTGYTAPNMLTIIPYPTANTVNVKVCNNTSSSITPGAVTLNWSVRR